LLIISPTAQKYKEKYIKVNKRERNIVERKKAPDAKFEVHTVVSIFCGVTPCHVNNNRCFGEAQCCHVEMRILRSCKRQLQNILVTSAKKHSQTLCKSRTPTQSSTYNLRNVLTDSYVT
jgi:hypothetical protein